MGAMNGFQLAGQELTVGFAQPGMNTAPMLKNMFDPATVDLAEDPDFFTDVQEDVTEECGKHGPVAQVHVDKTSPDGQVLVKFTTPQGAMAASIAMGGRWFAGKQIIATLIGDDV